MNFIRYPVPDNLILIENRLDDGHTYGSIKKVLFFFLLDGYEASSLFSIPLHCHFGVISCIALIQ